MTGSCPKTDTLAGWLEGKLPAEEQAALRAHLAGCDDCRRAAGLAATLGVPPKGAALDEALLARVVSASRRRPLWRWTAAAAALAALGVSLWLASPRRSSGPAASPGPVAHPERKALVEAGRAEDPRIEIVGAIEPRREPVAEADPPPPQPPEPPAPAARRDDPPAPAPLAPPAPREPAPPVARTRPGETTPDLSRVFGGVYALDPAGDLWIRRGEAAPARPGTFEHVTTGDTLAAQASGGAFTLDGRATVVLEKGAEASIYFLKPDQAYEMNLSKGQVMVDTEGTLQNWRIKRNSSLLAFTNMRGRFSVEPRGEALAAVVLEGRGDVKAGGTSRKVEEGRELTVSKDGKLAPGGRADTRKKSDRLQELRPGSSTVFHATFDGKEAGPFAYTLVAGRRSEGEGFLEATLPAAEFSTGSEKENLSAGVRLDTPVEHTTGMILRFRYRATVPNFTVNLGEFSYVSPSKSTGDRWVEVQVPLSEFSREGVMMVPLQDNVPEVRFQAPHANKNSRLELDDVQLLRRAR